MIWSALLTGLVLGALLACSFMPDSRWNIDRRSFTSVLALVLLFGELLRAVGY